MITISNNFLTAKINTKGAELTSLQKNGREFIWQANPEFWAKHSPILFPIVGTLKNDTYIYDGQEFKLSRHGFARDIAFVVKELSAESVTFSLRPSEKTMNVYPFEFELLVNYSLEGSNLAIKYSVINNSEKTLPFSIGGHPAFSFPLAFENYSLEFKKDTKITSYFLEDDLLSDNFQNIQLQKNRLHLNYDLFKSDALILKELNSKEITVYENDLKLFQFEFNYFPNFGIWTKQDAPFLCLEPWFGYSDRNNSNQNILEKEGIVPLDKNKIFEASFSVTIF